MNLKIIKLKNIFNPNDFGYELININEIKGGDPEYNANCFKKMINGEYKSFQNIVEIPPY